ncbi:ZIP family metal transporter [Robertkochia solimangrovi]|uniref:ZIP family metal transporter n=1 Tax=Robertkochia solimangrovi TaxID=2213046 RepID=UPI001180095C|nr:ZIP family metal transporter [Robertkochia solimangrovi]TRZ43776.1 ZIP family metal transporter [Robertkochia solimangrovi]
MNYLLPIFAVLAGYLFVITFKPNDPKKLKLLLAFSGAFLLSITVFHLLPEVYHQHDHEQEDFAKNTGIFIMLGILLQIFLEFFSKGAEHGHMHFNKNMTTFPWLLFISLSIHAFLEGFPIHDHDTLVYGIVVHKFPVAVILSTFFIEAKISKTKVLSFLILFSLMTPAGTWLSEYAVLLKDYHRQITALVIGILLHISTVILFETSEGHKFNFNKLIVIMVGIVVAYFM